MFVGYSLNGVSANGKSVNEYQGDVLEQVRNDIKSNVSFIESKITQYGLDGYSMYIYLLPSLMRTKIKKISWTSCCNPEEVRHE